MPTIGDVLSSFSPQSKPSLRELCRVMGLPGKPDGIGGPDVERFFREGRVADAADATHVNNIGEAGDSAAVAETAFQHPVRW
jgi:hypothetical protein